VTVPLHADHFCPSDALPIGRDVNVSTSPCSCQGEVFALDDFAHLGARGKAPVQLLNGPLSLTYPFASKRIERQESPPFVKLYGVLFIPHAIMWRLTIDVVDDAASLFSDTVMPLDVLGAIFRMFKDWRGLCLDYCTEGNLDNSELGLAPSTLFSGIALAGNAPQANWDASYQHCLESALKIGGDSLLTEESCQQLSDFWKSLYPKSVKSAYVTGRWGGFSCGSILYSS
jgi:hypothetical protein